MRSATLLAAAAGAAGGASGACISDTSVGLHKRVTCGDVPAPGALGLPMHVTYNVPPQCAAAPCGLIVDVHGLTMDADIEDANTNMRALGAQHGYIVAQPTAPPGAIPFNSWGGDAEAAIVGWVTLALSAPGWRIDAARVHFMGFSQGASLAWGMLARHADLFASIVVMEFGHTDFDPAMAQLPVLYQNGIYDANWPLAPATVRRLTTAWRTDAGTVVAGDGTFNRTRYVSAQGVPFDFLVHHYYADYVLLGHCFPGSNDTKLLPPRPGLAPEVPLFGPFGCPGALSKHRAGYFIGEEAVKWFVAHPKGSGAAVAVAAPGCIPDASAGLHRRAPCPDFAVPWWPWRAAEIHVTYHVPAACVARSCGLVVDVHGWSMDADIEDRNTNMRALGERYGYIVAQPIAPPADPADGAANNWGWRKQTTAASDAAVVGWVRQALAEPGWRVDPARVHFVGFSEGGHMAWRMLCGHADLFASVAVLEATNGKPLDTAEGCPFVAGMREVPVLYQNGVYDVPEPFPYARRTVARLTQAWGAGAGVTVAGDAHYNRTRYFSAAGTPLDFIEHSYVADYVLLGHCFPGSNDTAFVDPSTEIPLVGPFGCPGRLSGQRAGYFIGDEVMDWFRAHPKAGAA